MIAYLNIGAIVGMLALPMTTAATRVYTRQPGSRPPGRPPTPAFVRFVRRYEVDPTTGCWLWTAGRDPDGYAAFHEGRGRGYEQRAHRYAYKVIVGPVPQGLVIDHLCRVRHCVNPAHMEPVTSQENVRRGRHPKAERTHCIRAHEFTPENTYMSPSRRGRTCRTCHALHERARRSRRRAA